MRQRRFCRRWRILLFNPEWKLRECVASSSFAKVASRSTVAQLTL
jgi:hypothetical protein